MHAINEKEKVINITQIRINWKEKRNHQQLTKNIK